MLLEKKDIVAIRNMMPGHHSMGHQPVNPQPHDRGKKTRAASKRNLAAGLAQNIAAMLKCVNR